MLSRQFARIVSRSPLSSTLGVKRLLTTTPILYSKVKLPHPNVVAADYKPPVTVEREFPDPFKRKKENRRYFLAYAIGVTLACGAIFNYEKTESPIVNSTLYFLRRSQASIDSLGSGIDFKSRWPWISGELNTVKGRIDIKFHVKGNKGTGVVKLKATRESKLHPFDVELFVLEIDGPEGPSHIIDLSKDPKVDFDI